MMNGACGAWRQFEQQVATDEEDEAILSHHP